jgi:hypothetical protein
LAEAKPNEVQQLAAKWTDWAKRCHVIKGKRIAAAPPAKDNPSD